MKVYLQIFAIICCLPIAAFGQGIKTITGKVTKVFPVNRLDQTTFVLTVNESGREETFMYHNWQPYRVALNDEIEISFLEGITPMAIGLNVDADDLTSIAYFPNIDPKFLKNYHQYSILGLYKGWQGVNDYTNITIEGAVATGGEFRLPDNIDLTPFEEDVYEGQELLLTYVMLDNNHITAIQKKEIISYEGKHVFKGIVKDCADSGLGPFNSITVVNQQTKEEFSGLIAMEAANEGVVGKEVEIKYSYLASYVMSSITSAPSGMLPAGEKAVVGIYEDCEMGDMNSYLYLSKVEVGNRVEDQWSCDTDFNCPESFTKGDRVKVAYTIRYSPEIEGFKVIE